MKKTTTEKKVVKTVHFKFHKDYGNFDDERVWTFKERYNGEPNGDPYKYYVLRKENFNQLQNVIEGYLEKGYTIEIKNK